MCARSALADLALFEQLVAKARALGVPHFAAEDVAQTALMAAYKKCPRDFGAYAKAATKRLAFRWHRALQSATRAAPAEDSLPLDRKYERLGELAKLSGALEQAIVWGEIDPGGTTFRVVQSLAEIDGNAITRELSYYLQVIRRAPASDRHRRRLRHRLLREIQAALNQSGYKYRGANTGRPLCITARRVSLVVKARPGSEDERGIMLNLDDVATRGILLIRLLGINVPLSKARQIANAAHAAVYGSRKARRSV